MPGWHHQTEKLVADGKLSVVGIVQEQHSDRASLYMQWQQMNWPVLADPFNDLGVEAVPITLLIDEHRIIRYRDPSSSDLKKFLSTEYLDQAKSQSIRDLPESIIELQKLISDKGINAKEIGRAKFRLGVAYRMRFDSKKSEPSDFVYAMKHWQAALHLNPNQYIWRRRIQQYGPRLDKPYSFYDWVDQARTEIIERGETPIQLLAEPSGAEFAVPSRGKRLAPVKIKHPDPHNKLSHDTEFLVSSSMVVVPSTNKNQPAVRVHLTLRPAEITTWTNDAGNISFHLDPSSKVKIKDLKIPDLPLTETSSEIRVVEFEIHPKNDVKLPKLVKAAVFYYICTKNNDRCQFLRKEIEIQLQ